MNVVADIRKRRVELLRELARLDAVLAVLAPPRRSPAIARVTENAVRDAVLDFVAKGRDFSASDVAQHLGLHPSSKSVRAALSRFAARGMIERVGTRWRYVPPPAYRQLPQAPVTVHREPVAVVASGRRVRTQDKDVNRLIALAHEQGLSLEQTANGHVRVRNGDGGSVIVSGTPGDRRALANAQARLRALGMKL
jgi:hypothetical protein